MNNILPICDNVSYIGVNDRSKARFENLWPLPYGVSYNSYLVSGSDRRALIDTVEADFIANFKHNLEINGDIAPDYLVVNHMEPDHSGSIPAIIEAFPSIRIVGNRQTIGMIGGFYGITDPERFIEVKDGDSLDLGGLTLKFYLTPMVHWPETMMTYIEERGVLFSGDAFGCFGALNGAVMDSKMDTSWYFPEMERYYSNIVGKYGRFVQRALAKLKPLKLDYICSTHGPVWHEKLRQVIDLYDRLSRYEAEEGVVIIYGSMYGNTEKVAEEFARQLADNGIRKIRVHNAAKAELSDMIADVFRYKGLIVGAPTYSMHLFPPVEDFMIAMETRELQNRAFMSFGSYTWSSVVQPSMDSFTEKMKLPSLGHFDIKQALTPEGVKTIAELARKMAETIKD